ncbi:hypothetical protein PR048_026220 [Dryococelus australis]|uniref:Uncharacterized protein n=1 Tax=Dryococelus australis TaxID=614101 RepID=A0ABQ9GKR4_9NEOP|nr:hypothetical protein PR048_026220 [Dryococelus australis]
MWNGAGMTGRGKREIPEKTPPTNSIARRDSQLRKFELILINFAILYGAFVMKKGGGGRRRGVEHCTRFVLFVPLTLMYTSKEKITLLRWQKLRAHLLNLVVALTRKEGGVTVAERLACSPPTGFNLRPGGNRAGRCHWSEGFLDGLPFPPPSHSGAAPCAPRAPLSAPRDFAVKELAKSLRSLTCSATSQTFTSTRQLIRLVILVMCCGWREELTCKKLLFLRKSPGELETVMPVVPGINKQQHCKNWFLLAIPVQRSHFD